MTLRLDQDDASRRAKTERRVTAAISEAKLSMATPGHAERIAASNTQVDESEFRTIQLKRKMERDKATVAARRRNLRTGAGFIGVVVLFVISFGLGRMSNRPLQTPTAPPLPLATQPSTDTVVTPSAMPQSSKNPSFYTEDHKEALIFAARDMVKARLKDGQSAKFTDEQVGFYHGVPVVCGLVNAKNSFGGYDGAQRYIAASDKLTVLEEDTKEMDEMWSDGDCHMPR